jgi:hypothetical protein
MDINEVFDIVKYRAAKGGYSSYISPNDFNLLFNKAQLRYFNKLYIAYASNQRISDALSKFVSPPQSLALSGGIGDLTTLTNLVHLTSVMYNNNTVKRVEVDRLANNLSSTYDAPSEQYPIYVQYNGAISVYPINLTGVQLTYLTRPRDVKWAYTVNNTNPNLPRTVYDLNNSVQPVWADIDIDNIVFLMLSDIGINARDQELENFALTQEKTNSN